MTVCRKWLGPLGILSLIIIVQACNLGPYTPGIWKNEHITKDVREEMHTLTDSLFSHLKAGRESEVESMLSSDLLENNSNKRTRQIVANHLKAEKYILKDEYYGVNKRNGKDYLIPDTKGVSIHYMAVTPDTYVAFFLPKKSANQQMITLVMGKFSYGWRIDKIEIAPYKKNGQTSAEMFETARQQYEKGYLVDAVNTMAGAMECARPSEELDYPDNSKTSVIYNAIVNQANDKYKFPMVLNGVPGKPEVFRISTFELKDGTYPTISYLSKISLKDTAALKQQNIAVKKVIGNVFKGIDKDKKHLIYYIYNEKPDRHSNSYSYDIIDDLK